MQIEIFKLYTINFQLLITTIQERSSQRAKLYPSFSVLFSASYPTVRIAGCIRWQLSRDAADQSCMLQYRQITVTAKIQPGSHTVSIVGRCDDWIDYQ